jgi:type 1 fimbria pilin
MTTAPRKLLASTFLTLSCFAMAADPGSNITVTGWVIDSACAYTVSAT